MTEPSAQDHARSPPTDTETTSWRVEYPMSLDCATRMLLSEGPEACKALTLVLVHDSTERRRFEEQVAHVALDASS